MKFLGNSVVFAILYVLFMLLTYYLPYIGSNSAVIGALGASGESVYITPMFWAHLGALTILIVITWFRGVLIDKTWLVIFPILATVFDLAPMLNLIPLVPTVMHLFAIILGVSGAKAAIPATEHNR